MQTWSEWQQQVLALLKRDFGHVLGQLSFDDVDWSSWRLFFDQGRSPRSAIERALEKDI